MKPNTITLNPDEELAEILSRCRFVPRVGTRRFGPRFAVELWSRSHFRDLTGNLHLRIVPLVPLASTDEAFLQLAIDAHREMSLHAHPGIAAFARRGLERLTGERLPAGALEHRRIMLCQGETSHEAWTNQDGEADFPGVELDKECSLSMDAVKASNVLTVRFERPNLRDFNIRFPVAMAAAGSVDTGLDEEVCHPLRDPEIGLEIEARLQPTADGKTRLTLRSTDKRAAEAGVEYEIGVPGSGAEKTGQVRLSPKKQGVYWQGLKKLDLPFAVARQAPSLFTIFLKPENNEGPPASS
jgi:hypothetical protein